MQHILALLKETAPIALTFPPARQRQLLGLRLRNQDYLHVLYASQVPLKYTVLKPRCKQPSLRNSTRSLIERGVESLGNLNKSLTVRNMRGLPFDAPYACTGMHNLFHSSLSYLILPNITNHSVTQPRGELLLGLPTLLTTHHVNAEEDRSQKNPKRLNNPTANYKQP